MYTRTLAELYASQGAARQAIEVLRRILAENPADEEIARRVEELEAGASQAPVAEEEVETLARDLAASGARVVVLPDLGGSLETLDPCVEKLAAWGVPFLIDPIIEPIGFGFTASIERYAETRRRYPEAEMLMGIGNLTEMTAADSTGVNAVLPRYWASV